MFYQIVYASIYLEKSNGLQNRKGEEELYDYCLLYTSVSALLFNITGMNLINLITTFIQEPLRHISTGLWGCIILYSLGNMLWFFGIHQSVIYSSILEPLLIINITENIAAFNAGQEIPNIINVSQVATFGLIGGSGSTICLLTVSYTHLDVYKRQM